MNNDAKYHISNNFYFTALKTLLWPQLVTMAWNMNMYTVCFQTIALLSPMQSMEQEGTGSSAPN